MTLADNFTPLIPGVLVGVSLVAIAGVFYWALGSALFTIGWMAAYVAISVVVVALLVLALPAGLFPSELASLRSAFQQKLWKAIRPWRPAAVPRIAE